MAAEVAAARSEAAYEHYLRHLTGCADPLPQAVQANDVVVRGRQEATPWPGSRSETDSLMSLLPVSR